MSQLSARRSSPIDPRPPLAVDAPREGEWECASGSGTTISIVTPCYNSAKFVERAYRSLCEQGDAEFEWIVVDDKSPDDTIDTLRDLAAKAPFKMRIFALPVNSGGGMAYAFGAQMARGHLVFFLDHDDALLPNVLSGMAQDWDRHGRTGKFCGLLYRSMNPETRRFNSPPLGFGAYTMSRIVNTKPSLRDALFVFDRSILQRVYTYELADKTIYFGVLYSKLTAVRPVLYCRDDAVKLYYLDNDQAMTKNLVLSRQLIFVYAENFNQADVYYLRRPMLYLKRLFNLVRFSDQVYGSPAHGLALVRSRLVRALGYAMIPGYLLARSRLKPPLVYRARMR